MDSSDERRILSRGAIGFARAGLPRPHYVQFTRHGGRRSAEIMTEVTFNPEYVAVDAGSRLGLVETDEFIGAGPVEEQRAWISELLKELDVVLCPEELEFAAYDRYFRPGAPDVPVIDVNAPWAGLRAGWPPMDFTWVGRVRGAMDPLGGSVYQPPRHADALPLTMERVALGRHLGLLNSEAVVQVELDRLQAGAVLEPAEEEVALLLPDDFDRVPELVEGWERGLAAAPWTDLYWFDVLLDELIRQWEAGFGDPATELGELVSAWGGGTEHLLRLVRPRLRDLFSRQSERGLFLRRLQGAIEDRGHDAGCTAEKG